MRKGREARTSFARYRFDPLAYIREKLGWDPWAGIGGHPGQVEVIEAYRQALLHLHEKRDFERGLIAEADLVHWKPGQVIKNRIRVRSGHTIGKSKLASGIVNHFFDTCTPSITYTFAPTADQVRLLLWKEIKADRAGKGLPGKVLDVEPQMAVSAEHFAIGRATSNVGGHGSENIHGQHAGYALFVVDEAEGVDDYVFDAIDSMVSGGIAIVLVLANPRTRTSRFHRMAAHSNVASFHISCLWHPNVVTGREVVPGAVRRDYVRDMIETRCKVVEAHDEREHTFTLPFEVTVNGTPLPPGTIFKPNAEFCWRVLGVAPLSNSGEAMVSPGQYEAAVARKPLGEEQPNDATLGLDVARFGSDIGTLYVRWGELCWRAGALEKRDGRAYLGRIKEVGDWLYDQGVRHISLRVDGGGGFGGGVLDLVKGEVEWLAKFATFAMYEVHFQATPTHPDRYYDKASEMYGESAAVLGAVCLIDPPGALEDDLIARKVVWVTGRGGASVRRIEPKSKFKERLKRSPDDGDGAVLCLAPAHLFDRPVVREAEVRSIAPERRPAEKRMRGVLGGLGLPLPPAEYDNEARRQEESLPDWAR